MSDKQAKWWEYFMSRATRAYWRESRKRGQSFGQTLHGYIYGRWPALYIGLLTGRHPLARPFIPVEGWLRRMGFISDKNYASFVDGYHGKVLEVGAARQLIDVQRTIEAALPEKMLPYPRARDIILEAGDSVALMECPCRVSKPQHCTPVDVCIVVGKIMVDFVLTHHKFRARRVTPEQALEVMEACQKRGHAAHAFFKDAVLNRFYTICNCCSCCCAAIQTHNNGTPTLASSGFVVQVHEDKCTGCGLCEKRCPFDVIQKNHPPVINTQACMGCGICAFNCPTGALELVLAPDKGQPLNLGKL